MMGNMLRERDQQYIAVRDEATKTWRLLDTWHESLKNLQSDDDVEDDNPAITVLTEGAFISLVREAARIGTLENASFGVETMEPDETLVNELKAEISGLKEQLSLEKQEVVLSKKSLKETAMEHIVKLAAMDDMTSLSK